MQHYNHDFQIPIKHGQVLNILKCVRNASYTAFSHINVPVHGYIARCPQIPVTYYNFFNQKGKATPLLTMCAFIISSPY